MAKSLRVVKPTRRDYLVGDGALDIPKERNQSNKTGGQVKRHYKMEES